MYILYSKFSPLPDSCVRGFTKRLTIKTDSSRDVSRINWTASFESCSPFFLDIPHNRTAMTQILWAANEKRQSDSISQWARYICDVRCSCPRAPPVSPRLSAPFDLRKSAVHSNTDRLLRHSMNTESAHYHSFNSTPATATAKDWLAWKWRHRHKSAWKNASTCLQWEKRAHTYTFTQNTVICVQTHEQVWVVCVFIVFCCILVILSSRLGLSDGYR